MKTVKAVAPYSHGINFKMQTYDAWTKAGGRTMRSHYPWRIFHRFAFDYELPTIRKSKDIAQLRFVEPVSINFDTFPDYACHEIIPFIWDCWPRYFEKTCKWFKRHDVRTAIFTSSQTAERMRERFPEMNILWCPEGIDTSLYSEGKELKNREIDILEFGRSNRKVFKAELPSSIRHVCTMQNGKYIFTNEELRQSMGDAKVTITLPRSITQPDVADDIETLTQRYWECMLTRMVMVGHAPKELVDFIGYNPVIEIDTENPNGQINDILQHLADYRDLTNKNREVALQKGDWTARMQGVMDFLKGNGYRIS
ncbi:MAG: hypothetical protein IKN75_00460 [Prevotella sp.]|nr:hypothetical protein [Prevotella sp.]